MRELWQDALVRLGAPQPARPTFLATHDVPRHVRRTLRRYVDCGVLAKGFVRVRCPDCTAEST